MRDQQNDIEKYLKGELSPAEMHALEKRALSDPFLADALEGASSVKQDDFSADVQELHGRLRDNTKDETVTLWVWAARIAAGLAIIAVATFFILRMDEPSDKIAQQNPGDTDQEQNIPKPEAPEAMDSVSGNAGRKRRQTSAPLAASDNEEPVREEIVIPDVIDEDAPAVAMNPNADNLAPRFTIRGHVVDADDGKGLPGVNVIVKGTNVGTITDEEGNYQLTVDSISDGLLFSYIGFESTEVSPGNSKEVSVALKPDIAQLSEIVVVGYGFKNEGALVDAPTIEMAAPAGGRKAFKQYLEQNLRYPSEALNHKVEGKVTVQFTIESTGQLSDFRVLKGLGYGCDEEVIRLIKEGPKWIPTKRNADPVRDKVKVRMRFSLPKKQ